MIEAVLFVVLAVSVFYVDYYFAGWRDRRAARRRNPR